MKWILQAGSVVFLLIISIPMLPGSVAMVMMFLLIHIIVVVMITFGESLHAMFKYKFAGSYIAVEPTEVCLIKLQQWWLDYKDKLPPEMQGTTKELNNDMHVTVINSSRPVLSAHPMCADDKQHYSIPPIMVIEAIADPKLAIYKYKTKTGEACCLVLQFKSVELKRMNEEFKALGGKENYSEFKAHLSLVYGIDAKFANHHLYQPRQFPFLLFDKLIHRPRRVY